MRALVDSQLDLVVFMALMSSAAIAIVGAICVFIGASVARARDRRYNERANPPPARSNP